MSFLKLASAAVALYALLNFVVIPRLAKAWRANRTLGKAAKAGVVGAAEFARDVTLVAGGLYVAFGLLTVLLGFTFGKNVGLLAQIVAGASHLHTVLGDIKRVFDAWFFLLPLGILVYVSWRRQRRGFGRRYESVVDAEHDRLNREREEDPARWNALPADERMRSLDQEIDATERQLAALDPAATGATARRQAMLRRIVQLKESRQEADYERRIDVAGVDDAATGGDPPRGWRAFLMSRGLFADIKGGGKLLSRATLVLLSLASIGAASAAGLSGSLWNRIVVLDQLRVNLEKEQVAEQWQRAGEPAPLDAVDKKALDQLTNDFASNLLHNSHWVSHASASHGVEVAHLRQTLAERAILAEVRLPDAAGGEHAAFIDDSAGAEHEVGQALRTAQRPESAVGHAIAAEDGGRVKSWFGARWDEARNSILAHANLYREPVDMKDVESAILDKVLGSAVDGAMPDFKLGELGKQARGAMNAGMKRAVNEAVTTEFRSAVMNLAGGKPYDEVMKDVKTRDIPITRVDTNDLAVTLAQNHLPTPDDIDRDLSEHRGRWQDPDAPTTAAGEHRPGDGPFGVGGVAPGEGWPPPPDGPAGGDGPPTPPRPSGGTPPAPSAPGGGFSSGGEGAYSARSAEESVIREIAERHTSGGHPLSETAIEAVAGYEDHFPRSVASLERTTFGRAIREFRGASNVAALAASAELKVARAGSFAMLRGFSRVGGVLIGREPEDPKSRASVLDITWRKDGRLVTLSLIHDSKGGHLDLGPFDRSLIHQALAYAADGRPVAVTMTNARPLPQLKINLHPALLDTPVGCRITHLDRLVDTYAGADLPKRQEIAELYEQQNAIYDVAWAARAEVIARLFSGSSDLKAEAEAVLRRYRPLAEAGLRRPTPLGPESILRRKPEFYDAALIDAVEACAPGAGVSELERCIRNRVTDSDAFKDRSRRELTDWLSSPTTIMEWSGVRERAFNVTRDLGFLRSPAGDSVAAQLWPFDFMVQIAFTSPPAGLPADKRDVYADQHPLEFDEIAPEIQQRVLGGVGRDALGPMFNDLRAFTMLQRLFRVALHGGLGPRFPLAKLGELTAETAGGIPYVRTPRWNGSQTRWFEETLAHLLQVKKPSEPWMRDAATRGHACMQALTETRGDRPPLHAENCDLDSFEASAAAACPRPRGSHTPACDWRTVVSAAPAMPMLRHYEFAFGVVDDAIKSQDNRTCPPLAPPAVATSGAGGP